MARFARERLPGSVTVSRAAIAALLAAAQLSKTRVHYRRGNVESTFAMIKAKFGDSVRSKIPTAMVNEALCKVLCHNLCCLIQSTHELGVEAKFWRGKAKTEPVAWRKTGSRQWLGFAIIQDHTA